MSKIYLAGPWFTPKMRAMMNVLEGIYDVTDNKKYEVYFPERHSYKTPKKTFLSNVKAIENCELMIACISEKDTGTAFEIGYAKKKGIPIYLLVNDESHMTSKTNIMLAYATDGVITLKDFQQVLTEGIEAVKLLKFDNKWEGKE